MSALPDTDLVGLYTDSAKSVRDQILHVVTPPPEMVESENLVVRQAHALVIASDEDYAEAGEFLDRVIVAGRKAVEAFFNPHVKRAHEAHTALTTDRAKHLRPWEEAERLVKEARVAYFQLQSEKAERERVERERAARALAEEQRRQEAEAERRRVAAEVQRRREEAEARRVEQEAEAERQRNLAAEQQLSDQARQQAEQRAREIEEAAAREAAAAAAAVTQIAEAGEAAAQAIEQEQIHLDLPSAPAKKLGGVAKAWGVDKERWDRVAFALWIAGNPEKDSPAWIAARDRAKYIGEPAWALLTSEAKQQESLFDVGGITAGPKLSGRAGAK
jgi:hypothetical protein